MNTGACSSSSKQKNLAASVIWFWDLLPLLRKATEIRHVSMVSLNGGLIERPLSEAVKLKTGLPWRTKI